MKELDFVIKTLIFHVLLLSLDRFDTGQSREQNVELKDILRISSYYNYIHMLRVTNIFCISVSQPNP